MAQSKSRIVIWTIVGILAVVAVIMLVTRPKTPAGGPTIDAADFAQDKAGVIDRLQRKVDRQGFTPEVKQQIDAEIEKARAVLQEIQGMTGATQVDLRKKVDEFQDHHVAAKKMMRDAGHGDDE